MRDIFCSTLHHPSPERTEIDAVKAFIMLAVGEGYVSGSPKAGGQHMVRLCLPFSIRDDAQNMFPECQRSGWRRPVANNFGDLTLEHQGSI